LARDRCYVQRRGELVGPSDAVAHGRELDGDRRDVQRRGELGRHRIYVACRRELDGY